VLSVALESNVRLIGKVGPGHPPEDLAPGREVVLFAPVGVADLLPAGTLLDDWLDRDAREAIDDSAAAHLARWRESRAAIDDDLGVPLLSAWDMELLADVFLTTLREVEGALRLAAAQEVAAVELVELAPDLAQCLEELLRARGVEVTVAGRGTPPDPVLAATPAPPGLPSRVVSRTGLPARPRGGSVLWPYWHLEGVARTLAAEPGLRPVFDVLNLPLSLSRGQLVDSLARGGWWARPGTRALRASRARVAAALERARRLPAPGGALEQLLDSRALDLLAARAGDTPAWHDAASHTLGSRRIRVCVLPFDSPPEARTMAEAARAQGVPTVVVQHGGVHPEVLQSDRTFADAVAVWSADDARRLEGRAHGRLVVTGNPGAVLASPPPPGRRPERTIVLVESATRLSTIADVRMPLQHLDVALSALEAVRPGTEVVVRPHPSERAVAAIERVAGRHPGVRATVRQGGAIEPMLGGSDLCVGAISTATLQAGARGCRVVMLNVAPRRPPWPLDGQTDVAYATSVEELEKAITSVLAAQDPPGARLLEEALGARPAGDAEEAVLALIRETARATT
jgi:hypothetical protein